jgi:hypothetical protein
MTLQFTAREITTEPIAETEIRLGEQHTHPPDYELDIL